SLFEGQNLRCALQEGWQKPAVGDQVSLCIKPEAVLPLVAQPDASNNLISPESVNNLPCRLDSSSYQGSLADLRLSLVGSPTPIVLRATVPAQTLSAIAGQSGLT